MVRVKGLATFREVARGATAPEPIFMPRASMLLAAMFAVATTASTQFLMQPFVWRNFSGPQILLGWSLIWRDRLVVAGAIAIALLAAPRRRRLRFGPLFLAIVAGALAGESAVVLLDPFGGRNEPLELLGRALQWSVVGAAICAILALWQRNELTVRRARQAELDRLELNRLRSLVEMEGLRRQLEPHFLFNTLATIRGLGRSDPAEGRRLLSNFLEYVRSSIATADATSTTLGEEADIVRAYLTINAVRMGARLDFSIDLEPVLRKLPFPRLALATLVENAIKHGLEPDPKGGRITVEAHRDGAMLEVSVTDDGVGFTGELGNGVGLTNVRRQLQLLHGGKASLLLQEIQPSGVRATIRLPVRP